MNSAPTSVPVRETSVDTVTKLLALLLEASIVLMLVVLFLEGASRLVHRGVRPMLPYVTDDSLNARMPPAFDSKVQFSGSPAFLVCTDEDGMRGNRCGPRKAPPRVVTVGDSQAFGWAMDFSDSMTTKVAEGLGERDHDAARAMAVAGSDVETLLSWARDYRAHTPASIPAARLNIVVVNLGNDLDEMYFSRAAGQVPKVKTMRDWLTVHSFSILDYELLRSRMSSGAEGQLPPGANPVLIALTARERQQLALGTADAAARLVHALPPAQQSVVLLLPNDYQVARSEFMKYRSYYPNAAQFESWWKRIDVATSDLDQIEEQVAQTLRGQGLLVAQPRHRLQAYDPLKLLDRRSHHYTPFGQTVLAASVLEAVGQPSGTTQLSFAAGAHQ